MAEKRDHFGRNVGLFIALILSFVLVGANANSTSALYMTYPLATFIGGTLGIFTILALIVIGIDWALHRKKTES